MIAARGAATAEPDAIDAEVAARSVLAETSTAIPKTADGLVEMIRQVKIARDTARKGRTSATITLKNPNRQHPRRTARIPRRAHQSGAHQPLRTLPRVSHEQSHSRGEALTESVSTPLAGSRHRGALTRRRARRPHHPGVADTTRRLWHRSRPRRRSSSSCSATTPNGSAPKPHTPNSAAPVPSRPHQDRPAATVFYGGGHRQANAALYRIAIVRMRHQPTIDYVARRTTEGLTKKDIIRCLK